MVPPISIALGVTCKDIPLLRDERLWPRLATIPKMPPSISTKKSPRLIQKKAVSVKRWRGYTISYSGVGSLRGVCGGRGEWVMGSRLGWCSTSLCHVTRWEESGNRLVLRASQESGSWIGSASIGASHSASREVDDWRTGVATSLPQVVQSFAVSGNTSSQLGQFIRPISNTPLARRYESPLLAKSVRNKWMTVNSRTPNKCIHCRLMTGLLWYCTDYIVIYPAKGIKDKREPIYHVLNQKLLMRKENLPRGGLLVYRR